eukprot:c15534_g2_i1 orf=181-456(+)
MLAEMGMHGSATQQRLGLAIALQERSQGMLIHLAHPSSSSSDDAEGLGLAIALQERGQGINIHPPHPSSSSFDDAGADSCLFTHKEIDLVS